MISRKYHQRNRSHKKNYIEIVDLKNIISEIINSLGALKCRMKRTEDGINESEDRSRDLHNLRNREKIYIKKEKVLGTCRTVTKKLTAGVPEEEDRESVTEIVFRNTMTNYFSNLVKHVNLAIREVEWINQSNTCRDLSYGISEYRRGKKKNLEKQPERNNNKNNAL